VTKALTAIAPGHAELAAAREPASLSNPAQVADAASGRTLVAVAGTHGKSTSSGWLVHVLASAGMDPGAFVGALLPGALTGIGLPATARRGAGMPFVVEADEYAGNSTLRPSVRS
jgi:UDP-N-acetylmuramate-alanine ligase